MEAAFPHLCFSPSPLRQCLTLPVLLTTPFTPAPTELDSGQQQDAVSSKEKAKKKLNSEHWNALNHWPVNFSVLSDE